MPREVEALVEGAAFSRDSVCGAKFGIQVVPAVPLLCIWQRGALTWGLEGVRRGGVGVFTWCFVGAAAELYAGAQPIYGWL